MEFGLKSRRSVQTGTGLVEVGIGREWEVKWVTSKEVRNGQSERMEK